jgi:hypothetical protein
MFQSHQFTTLMPKPRRKHTNSSKAKKQKLDLVPLISKEEIIEKQRRLHQIKEYKKSFPKKCVHIKVDKLETKSVHELSQIVENIQQSLESTSGKGSDVKTLVDTFLSIFQKVANGMGIKIESLHTFLETDSDWKDLIKEAEIKYASASSSTVENRLLKKVLFAAAELYKNSQKEEAIKTTAAKIVSGDKEVEPDLFEKYSDL